MIEALERSLRDLMSHAGTCAAFHEAALGLLLEQRQLEQRQLERREDARVAEIARELIALSAPFVHAPPPPAIAEALALLVEELKRERRAAACPARGVH